MKRAATGGSPPAKRAATGDTSVAKVKQEGDRPKTKSGPKRGANAAVLQALKESNGGLAQDALAKVCKMSFVELAPVLNALTKRRQIQLAKGPDGDIIFMLTSAKDVEAATKLDELSTNELHVFQTIQDKGRDGIWKRDIKQRTGLVEKEVNKILNMLQKKKLVKMEKTVLRQNGKMFFLYDIEPSTDHTGGVWYRWATHPSNPPASSSVTCTN